jgi:rod shape-determining protein MreC
VALLREPGARYAPARSSALGLKAIILASLAIGLMVVDHRQQHLKVIREGLTAVAYPFQVLVHSPVAGWEWLTSNFATRNTLLAENRQLKERQWRNELRLMRFEAVEQENLRLRKLVDAAPRAGERVMLAEILRVDLDPFRHRVILDRGERDGVTKGQAVVDGAGVFGQVTNVGPYSSEVILLSDTAHAIPVQISRNGLRTIAVGTGDARRLQLPYLPRNADVKVDDVLLTSGLGGVFPGGYPVARVTEVKRDPASPLAVVNAVPAAALDRDNEVLLVWFTPRVPVVPEATSLAPADATAGKPGTAAKPTAAAAPANAKPPAREGAR